MPIWKEAATRALWAALAVNVAAPLVATTNHPDLELQGGTRRIDKGRVLLRGTVIAANGKPWAKARVTLIARPWAEAAPLDVHELISDERGRFVARALAGESYACWAMTNFDARGRYRSTKILEYRPGEHARLNEIAGACMRTRVFIAAPKRLAARGLHVIVNSAWREPVELVPEAGFVTLPALPGGFGRLSLRTRPSRAGGSAETIWLRSRARSLPSVRVATACAAREKLFERARRSRSDTMPDPAVDLERLETAEMMPLLLRVTHDGKAVAGARVDARRGSPVPSSDAEGFLKLLILEPRTRSANTWKGLTFDVRAPGMRVHEFHESLQLMRKGEKAPPNHFGGTRIDPDRDLEAARRDKKPDFEFRLASGRALKGRLLCAKGKPASAVPLRCFVRPRLSAGPAARFGLRPNVLALRATTKADGRFEFDGLQPFGRYTIHALLDDAQREATGRPELRSVAFIAEGSVGGKDLDLGELVMSQMPVAQLRVRCDDGAPARYAPILVARGDHIYSTRWQLDRLGSAAILLPSKGRWRCASRFDGHSVDCEREFAEGVNQIVLDRPVWITGRVQNDDGVPLEGVRVSVTWSQPADGTLLGKLGSSVHTQSDAEGRYKLSVRRQQGRCWLSAHLQRDGKLYRVSRRPTLSVADDDIRRDLVLPAPVANPGLPGEGKRSGRHKREGG